MVIPQEIWDFKKTVQLIGLISEDNLLHDGNIS